MKVALGIVGDRVPSASFLPSLCINTERFAGNTASSSTVQVSVTAVPSVIGLTGSLVIMTDKIDGSMKKINLANAS